MNGIYESMLFNAKTADVVFLVGSTKERIPAHAAVLAEACEPFQQVFSGDLPREDEIHVPDCEPEEFKVLLRHIYTGKLELTDADVEGVAFVAKKYMVDDTYREAVSFLVQGLTKDRVCELLAYLPSTILFLLAGQFWMVPDREAEAVLSSPQFLVVDYETLKEIIGRDTNNAGETTVYSGAVEWARMNLGGTTASDGMVRVLLGEVLYLIRFPLKSIDEFANGPAKDAILTSDEVIAGNA